MLTSAPHVLISLVVALAWTAAMLAGLRWWFRRR